MHSMQGHLLPEQPHQGMMLQQAPLMCAVSVAGPAAQNDYPYITLQSAILDSKKKTPHGAGMAAALLHEHAANKFAYQWAAEPTN